MAPQHQNPEEAVQGMKLCNAAFAAGCHWGTFQLTDEPIDEPAQKAARGARRARRRARTLSCLAARRGLGRAGVQANACP